MVTIPFQEVRERTRERAVGSFSAFEAEINLTFLTGKSISEMVLSTSPRGKNRFTEAALVGNSESVNDRSDIVTETLGKHKMSPKGHKGVAHKGALVTEVIKNVTFEHTSRLILTTFNTRHVGSIKIV